MSRLLRITRDDFDELFDEMLDLPSRDVSLQISLPRLLSPALQALRAAIAYDDDESVADLVGPAVAEMDNPIRRAELVRAVQAFAEAGGVDRLVAAVAVTNLAAGRSALLRSSLLEALAVSVGAVRTPGGLLVVSS